VITRAGDESLRSVLVVGATAVLRHLRAGRGGGDLRLWLEPLLKRKPPKLVAVALANKLARIAWKLMVTGQAYAAKSADRLGGRGLEICQTRGASQPQPC
jgi:transposase